MSKVYQCYRDADDAVIYVSIKTTTKIEKQLNSDNSAYLEINDVAIDFLKIKTERLLLGTSKHISFFPLSYGLCN